MLYRTNSIIGDPVFRQGNAPVHSAAAAKAWSERSHIQIDDHPPCLPDLSPIEYVWVVPNQQLHKRYSDIADNPGGPGAVRAQPEKFFL